jgi:hypothetical protein
MKLQYLCRTLLFSLLVISLLASPALAGKKRIAMDQFKPWRFHPPDGTTSTHISQDPSAVIQHKELTFGVSNWSGFARVKIPPGKTITGAYYWRKADNPICETFADLYRTKVGQEGLLLAHDQHTGHTLGEIQKRSMTLEVEADMLKVRKSFIYYVYGGISGECSILGMEVTFK